MQTTLDRRYVWRWPAGVFLETGEGGGGEREKGERRGGNGWGSSPISITGRMPQWVKISVSVPSIPALDPGTSVYDWELSSHFAGHPLRSLHVIHFPSSLPDTRPARTAQRMLAAIRRDAAQPWSKLARRWLSSPVQRQVTRVSSQLHHKA